MELSNPFKRNGSLPTTPWVRREPGGIYVGDNRQVWLYRELPLAPLQWEDPRRRLEVGRKLETLLEEIGEKSKDVGQGMRMLSRNRAVHVFMVTYDTVMGAPDGTPDSLRPFLSEVLSETTRSKALLVGVQLHSSALTQVAKARGGLLQKAKAAVTAAHEDVEGSLDPFREDYLTMDAIFRRNETYEPRPEALEQMEGWFNHGLSADAPIAFRESSFRVLGGHDYEISAVMSFERSQLRAPFSQWLLDATTHPDPAVAVSIRAELEPASVTRTRIRRQRRKLIAADEEEAVTGDIGREENRSNLAMAEELESYVRQTRTAWLTDCSILLAREISNADETYADMLRDVYEIDSKVLEHRQREALREMAPTASERVNPFPQDLNPAMIAYGGMAAFSNLGDDTGVFVGNVDPDYVPAFVDPFGASRQNLPPVWGVFGDPGSGKTFACQLVAGQSAIAGVSSVVVNPKSADSLAPWARWVESMGAPVQIVSMSKMEERGGAFDPFRFCAPQMAAEVLSRHIQTVIGYALTPKQNILLKDGLTRGALAGARCAADALGYVEDPDVVELVTMMARSSTLFALGFGLQPQEPWTDTGGLTLIEFDRDLPLPKGGKSPESYEPTEREALAAMRLVTRAAVEILMLAGGGVLVVDEAHHFLSSEEGLATLDRIAREGRSMGLLPIFATQRVTDLLQVDMETFMSRVLVMKLNDEAEAAAALQLCRLEATPDRLAFLRQAGPRRGGKGVPSRSALGIFRDLFDRHAVVSIGPVPEHVRLAMSTNRDDRALRDQQEPADGETDPTAQEITP